MMKERYFVFVKSENPDDQDAWVQYSVPMSYERALHMKTNLKVESAIFKQIGTK